MQTLSTVLSGRILPVIGFPARPGLRLLPCWHALAGAQPAEHAEHRAEMAV